MANVLVEQTNQAGVDACADCQQACEACNYNCCLNDGEMAECGRLCLDCAAICQLFVTLLARGSGLAAELCHLCAEACDACAAECERYDMEYCQRCAEACRRCAEQCRAMAAA
jgi:hypothetical protein